MRLLLLEDDALLGEGLAEFLRAEGHVVEWFRCLRAVPPVASEPWDALLVDWQLPDGSGLDWVRGLRARGITLPVLLLTARDRLSDRVAGLDAGADDYLVKPFAPEELAARLRVVQRRQAGTAAPLLRLGDAEIDLSARRVSRDGAEVLLTPREWQLLEALAARPGRVVTRAALEALMLGFGGEVSSNSVEVHVSHLRRKLGSQVVETVRGQGYRVGGAA